MSTLGSVADMALMNAPIHKSALWQDDNTSKTANDLAIDPRLLCPVVHCRRKNLQRWNTGDQMSSASNGGYYGCSLGFYGNQHTASYESFVSRLLNNFCAKIKQVRELLSLTIYAAFSCIEIVHGAITYCFLLRPQCCDYSDSSILFSFSASFSGSKPAQKGLTSTTSPLTLWFLPWPTSSASPTSHLEHFCPCLHH